MTLVEKRPRLVGGIGGMLAAVLASLLAVAIVRLAFNVQANVALIGGVSAVVGGLVGALFPRIGHVAMSFALELLAALN